MGGRSFFLFVEEQREGRRGREKEGGEGREGAGGRKLESHNAVSFFFSLLLFFLLWFILGLCVCC